VVRAQNLVLLQVLLRLLDDPLVTSTRHAGGRRRRGGRY